jgi:hypothetical protein
MSRRQCAKCPWKKSTRPENIPNGYTVARHAELASTIAVPGQLQHELRIMACHETPVGQELPCVGWLAHQLGPGNNLTLRLAVIRGRIATDFELDGDQHPSFEETLPTATRKT